MPAEEKNEDTGCTPEYCVRPDIKNVDDVIRQAEKTIPVKQDDEHTASNNTEKK